MKRRLARSGSKGNRVQLWWYVLVGHLEGEADQVWCGQAPSFSEALKAFSRRLTQGLSASDRIGADVLMTAVLSAEVKPAVLFDGEHWCEERRA